MFEIDVKEQKSELISSTELGSFVSTSRTKSHVIFHEDDEKAQSFSLNPATGIVNKKTYKNMMEPSYHDDFVITEEA